MSTRAATTGRNSRASVRPTHPDDDSTEEKVSVTAPNISAAPPRRGRPPKSSPPLPDSTLPPPSSSQKKRPPPATNLTEEKEEIPPNDRPWYHFFTKGQAVYDQYMATEWGYEQRGDRALFEMLTLEGAQAGLSWWTILRKREAYRRTFHRFDIHRVAAMTPDDVDRIMSSSSPSNSPPEGPPAANTPSEATSPEKKRKKKRAASTSSATDDVIVRHQGKIESVINNAQCILRMQQEARAADPSSDPDLVLDTFLWSLVQNRPILHGYTREQYQNKKVPSYIPESVALHRALQKRGFKFCGPTTCYAFMQSVGMVVDHPLHSPEWQQARLRLQQRPGGYQDRSGPPNSD